MLGWALLADAVPLYPLYALLFTDSGLSDAGISALFAIWSAVGLVIDVPTGALADRFSRRGSLVAAGVLQAIGYVAWILFPTFPGFAAGFVLWGIGGSLVSGAREALLYDGLAAVGAETEYARVNGWVNAAVLLAAFPAAAAATVLFAGGGYELVGWASVGVCLAASVLATRLPEPARVVEPGGGGTGGGMGGCGSDGGDPADLGYLATLRAGLAEAAAGPGVRALLVAAALVGGFDALEEYFPLITESAGVPTAAVPLAMLPISVGGAVGAALGGRANRLGPVALGTLLGAGMGLLVMAGLGLHPVLLVGVALFYGAYQAVLVVVDARLQERIASRTRATVTSVADLGVGLTTFAIYAAWAFGGLAATAVLGTLIAAALPLLLRDRHDEALSR